jgi:hypothetical protein
LHRYWLSIGGFKVRESLVKENESYP